MGKKWIHLDFEAMRNNRGLIDTPELMLPPILVYLDEDVKGPLSRCRELIMEGPVLITFDGGDASPHQEHPLWAPVPLPRMGCITEGRVKVDGGDWIE